MTQTQPVNIVPSARESLQRGLLLRGTNKKRGKESQRSREGGVPSECLRVIL